MRAGGAAFKKQARDDNFKDLLLDQGDGGAAALSLFAEGATLRVELKTMTPNFQRFEVRLDGAGWKPSEENFVWNLHRGRNRMEARSVNKFGVRGPVSIAELEVL